MALSLLGTVFWRRVRNQSIAYVIRPAYPADSPVLLPLAPLTSVLSSAPLEPTPTTLPDRTLALAATLLPAAEWGRRCHFLRRSATQSVVGTERDGIWGSTRRLADATCVEGSSGCCRHEWKRHVYGAGPTPKVNALLDGAEQP